MTSKHLERLGVPYGVKIIGSRPIVLVAPHCPDKHEQFVNELVAKICTATNCFAIINTKISRRDVDLNDFDDISDNMAGMVKSFYDDLCHMIEDRLKEVQRPIVIFVHFTPRFYTKKRYLYERRLNGNLVFKVSGEARDFDVDIGCGLTENAEMDFSCDSSLCLNEYYYYAKRLRRNRGDGIVTCDREQVYRLQKLLMKYGLRAKVGREWAALSEKNMVQHVARKFSTSNVLQVEIIQDVGEGRMCADALVQVLENLM